VEAALTAALAAVGLPLAAVATAVLDGRLVSFWAVVAGGWVVFFFLRRRDRPLPAGTGRAAVSRAGTAERPVAGTGR
jgi:uncharacterized membrane protein YbhN (UPF0104 family)